MSKHIPSDIEDDDLNAASRKKEHIDLAFKARSSVRDIDSRFDYEPLFARHPQDYSALTTRFAGKTMDAPVWISSMTGGTQKAAIINQNLAKACGEYRLGMGLGSCRQLLYSDAYLSDFQLRKYAGEQPFYANLGIAQVESLLQSGNVFRIRELLDKLDSDGLIIHINPLQEWLQPEGDRYTRAPVYTIQDVLEKLDISIIVKEVGQGMGPASIEALLRLPLTAIDFAASGGTNFALMEILRSAPDIAEHYRSLVNIGHSAEEMVLLTNIIADELRQDCLTGQVIVSGGIHDFLDGYYLTEKSKLPAVYGQASGFLKHAMGDYVELQEYIEMQLQGLALAKAILKVKS